MLVSCICIPGAMWYNTLNIQRVSSGAETNGSKVPDLSRRLNAFFHVVRSGIKYNIIYVDWIFDGLVVTVLAIVRGFNPVRGR
jgi:hypothetical protein